MQTEAPERRHSAEERREEILEASMEAFAIGGLHGTSTEDIARTVGISQPYLFRLYGTKKQLYLAVVERGFDLVCEAFKEAAESEPDNPFSAMGRAYRRFLLDRTQLLAQMQAYAACSDDEVRAVVSRKFGELYRIVESYANGDEDEVRQFFATGMLLNVAAAMDMPSLLSEDWARKCLGFIPDKLT